MKKTKFSEEQILFALKQGEAGQLVADVCRQMGISEATYYNWKKRYASMGILEVRELRQLRDSDCDGRRIEIATQPAEVAGGSTICVRSPPGKDAERIGDSSSMRWRVKFATSFARRRHQSKLAKGSSSRCQPVRVSRNADPG